MDMSSLTEPQAESETAEHLAQIDALTGRELDAAIERVVFGREILGQAFCCWYPGGEEEVDSDQAPSESHYRTGEAYVYVDRCGCEFRDPENPYDAAVIHGHLWNCLKPCRRYSESIAEAWRVVEWVEAKQYGKVRLHGSHYHGWHCSVCWGQGDGDGGDSGPMPVWGVTAQESICRAALKCLRSEATPCP